MKQIVSTAPVGKEACSVIAFIERLDALAFWSLPLKGGETLTRTKSLVRYFRLEVYSFVESPWVTITEQADAITATLNGDETRICETPEEAFEALRNDCRSRLSEAGITPAF